MAYTYTKKKKNHYLKLKFNQVSCILCITLFNALIITKMINVYVIIAIITFKG